MLIYFEIIDNFSIYSNEKKWFGFKNLVITVITILIY